MIETVLGKIPAENLGITLMHEHILWDWSGADHSDPENYDMDKIIETMLPYLLSLKKYGCSTLVEATTKGAGRHVRILKECAKRSGLNIITNCGAWDGSASMGYFTPEDIRKGDIGYVVDNWVRECKEGIESTGIKPGFIKIALGDTGEITELQEKLLRAAMRTSIATGLCIQCHTVSSLSMERILDIIEEENLSPSRFIWVHADAEQDISRVMELMEKGIWVELDCLFRADSLDWYIDALKILADNNLIDRVLFSQDGGTFDIGMREGAVTNFYPFDRMFKEIIPRFKEQGISEEIFKKILRDNPAVVLDKSGVYN